MMIASCASLMSALVEPQMGAVLACCQPWIVRNLWLIPALPMAAAGLIALLKQPYKKAAAGLAIGSMFASFLLALCAFSRVLLSWHAGTETRYVLNFDWLSMGASSVQLGWVLDPLAAVMLVMVTFVGLLIFIYSVGYMAHDVNFTRFFCFLALFAGGMLGVIIANSLLLLFMCWEIVGLTSYLLIGFWYFKPAAAAAAKKAFLTTRIGDIFFLLGIAWLFAQTGTTLFYNYGAGAIESGALKVLLSQPGALGLTAAGGIALLIFAGAAGKSGQIPLHVWLPDAMEGPTQVSALIHAATMVAAGVYLVARVYPLMDAGAGPGQTTVALTVVAWIGAATALYGALVAMAQNDIKRILAYSTVSQLGYMMVGLATGGVAVGMFHLITHAFFKALLFLGAGSVIHGCHDEQDIRTMGGLRKEMPATFYTYMVGMLALSGFPIFFSGFWSKDAIVGSAHNWVGSQGPFWMLLTGALLTAFYMTRQIALVFFGKWRGDGHAHESPLVMTAPLGILAFFAVVLGVLGTPAWPWFTGFLESRAVPFDWAGFAEPGLLPLMGVASLIVFAGLGLGWMLYGSKPRETAEALDPVERALPTPFGWLAHRLYFDELYGVTVLRWYGWLAGLSGWLDTAVWGGLVALVAGGFRELGRVNKAVDTKWIDGSFDKGCEELVTGGGVLAWLQAGRSPGYLRLLAFGVLVLAGLALLASAVSGQVRL